MSDVALMKTWRGLLAGGAAGLHLIDSAHPLQIFVGVGDEGAPRLVVRTVTKPVLPSLSHVVAIQRYEDHSKKWNLSFTLQDRKFDEVFLRLADDVHARSASSPNEAAALDRVGIVFDEWRRLLRPRATGLLSMEGLRGLVGELWLLFERFGAARPMEAAVEGWLGPLGLPQDFWFSDTGYCEAKAVGPASTRVRISSENQLDADDLDLIVLEVANTGEQTLGAVNLLTLVQRVRTQLLDDAASPDAFEERLSRMGVDLAEPFYQDTWFNVAQITEFRVEGEFPRITASALPPAVSHVTYQLELVDLAPYIVADTEVS